VRAFLTVASCGLIKETNVTDPLPKNLQFLIQETEFESRHAQFKYIGMVGTNTVVYGFVKEFTIEKIPMYMRY
jgi:hypothetical protein